MPKSWPIGVVRRRILSWDSDHDSQQGPTTEDIPRVSITPVSVCHPMLSLALLLLHIYRCFVFWDGPCSPPPPWKDSLETGKEMRHTRVAVWDGLTEVYWARIALWLQICPCNGETGHWRRVRGTVGSHSVNYPDCFCHWQLLRAEWQLTEDVGFIHLLGDYQVFSGR